jgi:hypothetical protein
MRELNEDQCLEAFYAGISPSKIYAPNVHYNEIAAKLGLELIPEKPVFTGEWFMPHSYKEMDLIEYFSNKVTTDVELERVALELDLFIRSGNENLLRYAIYLGDVIRENGIVTGVGRGSSVSVYCFFLAGLHKCNPIKYSLDCKEYFKISV